MTPRPLLDYPLACCGKLKMSIWRKATISFVPNPIFSSWTPSFAFFAKGGIQECRYQRSRIPPFAKSAKDGHPEIHRASCLAKHESRTCFFSVRQGPEGRSPNVSPAR
jgi:hypothetical protein